MLYCRVRRYCYSIDADDREVDDGERRYDVQFCTAIQ
jgi:hypothetical protein